MSSSFQRKAQRYWYDGFCGYLKNISNFIHKDHVMRSANPLPLTPWEAEVAGDTQGHYEVSLGSAEEALVSYQSPPRLPTPSFLRTQTPLRVCGTHGAGSTGKSTGRRSRPESTGLSIVDILSAAQLSSKCCYSDEFYHPGEEDSAKNSQIPLNP